MAANYTFTKDQYGVLVTADEGSGYERRFTPHVLLQADNTFIHIYDEGKEALLVNHDNIITIDGVAPGATLKLIRAQLDTLFKAAAASTANPVGASENHVGSVGGIIAVVGVEFTRPADTNAYIALDVVNNSTSAPVVMTFANIARIAAGSGYIVKARLVTDKKDCAASFKVHLFHTAPTAINDNSPYLALYANRANSIAAFILPATAPEDATNSTSAGAIDATLRIPYQCDGGSQAIYAVLETLTPFTPASGQKFYLELTADNN